MENDSSKNGVFSAADFTFGQKYSLFNKPLLVQYLILSFWIISGVMGLYYMLYDASYDDFVRRGILPYNLAWMGIVVSVFIVIGIALLIYPVDPLKYEKLRLEQHFDQERVQIEGILEDAHFSQAITQIETLLTALNQQHVHKDRQPLLKLLRKAEINRSLEMQIKDLRDTFHELSFSQRTMRYKNIQSGVQENFAIVDEAVSDMLRDLSLLFSTES